MTPTIALFLALSAPNPLGELRDYIQAMSPHKTPQQASNLARTINWAARSYGLDPMVLAAIARQESNFEPHTKVCYIVKRNHACYATCDYGLAQINQVWVDKWDLDAQRLVEDDAYNLRVSARILKNLYNQFADEEPDTWFSRYNTATSGPRAAYQAKIEEFLAMLP